MDLTSGGTVTYRAAGYEDDLYLLVKLGQAALVVFMVLAVVAVLYMLVSCCLALCSAAKEDSEPPTFFTRADLLKTGQPNSGYLDSTNMIMIQHTSCTPLMLKWSSFEGWYFRPIAQ